MLNVPEWLRRLTPESVKNWRRWSEWRARGFEAPSPSPVKRAVLLRNGVPGSTWVETGTYFGDTTKFLAEHFPHVITIEPEASLFKRANERFADDERIEVVNGTSEEVMTQILARVSGDVSFWLDGHFSGGPTFQGQTDCPIVAELDAIGGWLTESGRIAILVDDIRCFGSAASYPSIDYLVDWHRANGFSWHIEHDIFVGLRDPGEKVR